MAFEVNQRKESNASKKQLDKHQQKIQQNFMATQKQLEGFGNVIDLQSQQRVQIEKQMPQSTRTKRISF